MKKSQGMSGIGPMGLIGLISPPISPIGPIPDLPRVFGGKGYEKGSLAAFVDRNRDSDASLRRRANTRPRHTAAGTDRRFTNSGPSNNRLADHGKRGQGRSGRTYSSWLLQIEDHRRARSRHTGSRASLPDQQRIERLRAD